MPRSTKKLSKTPEIVSANAVPQDDLWIKIRYSVDGESQNIKLKDFVKIEDDFLWGASLFADGFYGYYHKDAVNYDTAIRFTTENGTFEIKKGTRDGKEGLLMREVPAQVASSGDPTNTKP